IEDSILPDDGQMPDLDQDILDSGVSFEDETETSISPLSDADSVFSSEIDENIDLDIKIEEDGDVADIDLESIPSPTVNEELSVEDETIGLSDDELDNILSTTEIVETTAEIPETSIEEDEFNRPLDFEDVSGLEPETTSSLVEKLDDTITLKVEETLEDEETETIDLSSLEADFNEVSSTSTPFTDDTKIDESTLTLSVSPSEEEDIYASLKDEMQKKKEVENPEIELKEEVKTVLSYLDQLLDALPEEKIKEFAESKTFDLYRKLFEELNIKH
ncbi:MAG TPA: hypothetical protein PK771_15585, partial [Spirochaetota bacterium]|nr:hypothetical protein [Spirochaetota bacterium]